MSSLFVNDGEKEFLDSSKFDLLSERLSNLFTIERLEHGEYSELAESLSECLLKLCQYLTDDYQLKSLNLKVIIWIMIDFVAFTPQSAATAIGNFQVHGPSNRLDPRPLPAIHQRLGSVPD